MNWHSWLLWGFISTIVLTTLMAGSQGLGMTRMNIPYLLGTIFTPNRDRAKILGFLAHLFNGWIFSLIYVAAFELLDRATYWIGGLLGLLHALLVLFVIIPILPGMHPRMASDQQGPTVVRQLEPPGFLAWHYGMQTPISVTIAHIFYGIILGSLYQLN
jgi:uncharacterized membrane protein YagU involved in acid resistance